MHLGAYDGFEEGIDYIEEVNSIGRQIKSFHTVTRELGFPMMRMSPCHKPSSWFHERRGLIQWKQKDGGGVLVCADGHQEHSAVKARTPCRFPSIGNLFSDGAVITMMKNRATVKKPDQSALRIVME